MTLNGLLHETWRPMVGVAAIAFAALMAVSQTQTSDTVLAPESFTDTMTLSVTPGL